MLSLMETELGLGDLNRVERDILIAARMLSTTPGAPIESSRIRNHTLVEPVAQATYHRALRRLLSHGFLELAGGSKKKIYVVRRDLMCG